MNTDSRLLSEAYIRVLQGKTVTEGFEEQMPSSTEKAEEVYGVNPEEAAEYDKMKAEISYEKYPFWDAYYAVKEGAWTEDDFVQWARSVWADGANNA